MEWATILVPLDESALSEAALPYAEVIAEATGASLHLLSIVEPALRFPVGPSDLRVDQVEQLAAEAEETKQRARAQYLAGRVAALQAQGLAVSSTVELGDPVDAILAAASKDDVTMVVMATRGHGAVGRLFIGSVADAVLRTGPRPTLLVRPPYARVPPRRARFEKLAVALDGSPLAETALPLAGELASAAGAMLHMVRVEPSLADSGEPAGALPGLSQLEEDMTAAARAYLAQARDQLPRSLTVETVVLQGNPAPILEEFVVHERIDLVVMSTRGQGGLRRLLLGSTAEALVRSGVPTLLVRAPAPADEPAEAPSPAPAVTVGEIMSRPVATAREDATLAEIARLMLERGIGCVPLVDAQGKLSGVITEVDLTGSSHYNRVTGDRIPYVFGRWAAKEELEARYQAGQTITAREVMSRPVVTASENELVVDVVQRMLGRERSCLPVTRDGVLVGMVTRHDLLNMIVRDPTGS
jgi:nucleotide-binding universal stress UspA family protein/predicted transcriptional regulator